MHIRFRWQSRVRLSGGWKQRAESADFSCIFRAAAAKPRQAFSSCPPSGWTADDVLEKTNWKWLAEAEPERSKPVLFFLEPLAGEWHTDEPYGCTSGDVAYVEAVFRELSDRHWFNIHESQGCTYMAAEKGQRLRRWLPCGTRRSMPAYVRWTPVSPAYAQAGG